jgi:hypothetical protein
MEQIPRFMKIRNDRFRVFWGPDRMGWVASRDVGAAVATVLREGPVKHSGQNYWLSVEVAGGDQLAAIFSEAGSIDPLRIRKTRRLRIRYGAHRRLPC